MPWLSDPLVCRIQGRQEGHIRTTRTGENLDAVTAVTDSFKMADVFAGDRTGGAVAQTSAQTICVSVWQGKMWVSWLQGMHGSSWLVVVRAKSAIVDPPDAAVTARGWCSISYVKPNNDPVTTKIPTQHQHHTLWDPASKQNGGRVVQKYCLRLLNFNRSPCAFHYFSWHFISMWCDDEQCCL